MATAKKQAPQKEPDKEREQIKARAAAAKPKRPAPPKKKKARKAAAKSKKPGRPTKYQPRYCKAIVEYFDIPPSRSETKRTYYANGNLKSEEPVTVAAQLPTFERFAASIGVHRDTLHEWAAAHTEFGAAMDRARQLQEDIVITNAINYGYSANFAKFFCTNRLDYHDRQDVNVRNDVTPEDRKLVEKAEGLLAALQKAGV